MNLSKTKGLAEYYLPPEQLSYKSSHLPGKQADSLHEISGLLDLEAVENRESRSGRGASESADQKRHTTRRARVEPT